MYWIIPRVINSWPDLISMVRLCIERKNTSTYCPNGHLAQVTWYGEIWALEFATTTTTTTTISRNSSRCWKNRRYPQQNRVAVVKVNKCHIVYIEGISWCFVSTRLNSFPPQHHIICSFVLFLLLSSSAVLSMRLDGWDTKGRRPLRVYTYTYIRIYIYVCMYVCMYVCVCVIQIVSGKTSSMLPQAQLSPVPGLPWRRGEPVASLCAVALLQSWQSDLLRRASTW